MLREVRATDGDLMYILKVEATIIISIQELHKTKSRPATKMIFTIIPYAGLHDVAVRRMHGKVLDATTWSQLA